MKVSLQLNLSQQLTLTPQLQQAIRLLQLSSLDLNQEVQEATEANPMLEMFEAGSSTNNNQPINNTESHTDKDNVKVEPQESLLEHSWAENYSARSNRGSSEEAPNYEHFYTRSESLREHLLWQLELSPLSQTDHIIALALIDSIDDSGFLTSSLEDIQASIPLESDQESPGMDEILAVLHRIQYLDPMGCGSQNVQECLTIQLNQLPKDTPYLSHAKQLVRMHLDLLAAHNYPQLMRKMNLQKEQLGRVLKVIQNLTPRPGAQVSSTKPEYIIPDVLVHKVNGAWKVELNPDSLPKVRINQNYAKLVQRADKSDDNTFMRNNLQEARWLIKSLQSRHDTLLKVAKCIVERQQSFLEHGAEAMKPLVLHTIADTLDMHESTISRVTTQKFMHTPQGVFELKFFFSSHVGTDTGGECSSTAIRAVIKKLVAQENPQKPLSDNQIANLLADQGIKVARRTIAKYRDSLAIPPSNERKSIITG